LYFYVRPTPCTLPSFPTRRSSDLGRPGLAQDLIRRLGEAGMWLPVVLAAPAPQTAQVVAAIKAGVLDYLRLPLEINSFAARLRSVIEEANLYTDRRRRVVEARQAIASLSRRERQVLDLLSAGCSNKEIARR